MLRSLPRKAVIAALAVASFLWLLPIATASAQAGGGSPVAQLYCYVSGPVTSPTSWAACSSTNPLPITGGGGGGGPITAAAGSYSAGAFVAGTAVDGWDVTQGTKGDTQATSGTGSWSVVALLKGILTQLLQIVSNTAAPIPTGTNNIGSVFGSPNVTQTDCSIALTTGGTAQNIITAGASLHGFRIMNIDTTAGSGEPVWMSFTTTAAASTIASYPLAAPTATTFAGAGSYSAEFASGTNGNVSVIAATSGHKISCTKW